MLSSADLYLNKNNDSANQKQLLFWHGDCFDIRAGLATLAGSAAGHTAHLSLTPSPRPTGTLGDLGTEF